MTNYRETDNEKPNANYLYNVTQFNEEIKLSSVFICHIYIGFIELTLSRFTVFPVMLLLFIATDDYYYRFMSVALFMPRLPCKHTVSCQYWADTGPMLPASAQYRPSTGN